MKVVLPFFIVTTLTQTNGIHEMKSDSVGTLNVIRHKFIYLEHVRIPLRPISIQHGHTFSSEWTFISIANDAISFTFYDSLWPMRLRCWSTIFERWPECALNVIYQSKVKSVSGSFATIQCLPNHFCNVRNLNAYTFIFAVWTKTFTFCRCRWKHCI